MRDYTEVLWRWAMELDNWLGIALLTGFVALLFYALGLWQNDSRRLERTMAKRAEQKKIAGILEVALDTEMRKGLITGAQKQKYCTLIGKALGIAELIPVPKPRLIYYPSGKIISIPAVALAKTKADVLRRLHAMGVNVAEKLKEVRAPQDKRKALSKSLTKKAS
jgi:hypothetical protein